MPLYHAHDPIARYLEVYDPHTGERIDGVKWVDTEWGLLKVYRIGPKVPGKLTRKIETKLEFDRKGRAHFAQQFDIVRRDFDVVDKNTHITIHRIRLRGEGTLDLTTLEPKPRS